MAVSPGECSQARFAQFTTVNFPDCILYRKPKAGAAIHPETDAAPLTAEPEHELSPEAQTDILERGSEPTLAAEPFDAVITDLGMPYVDGRQVARAIRATSAEVPIIMLTGWGRNLLRDTTPPPEVNRLLNKPPRLGELRAALAELSASTYAAAPDLLHEAIRRDPR
jgi:DNA-binding response OmpR family regulator